MIALSPQRFALFNDAVLDLYAADDVDALVRAVLEHLPRLVAMESAVFFPVADDEWHFTGVVSRELPPALFDQYINYYEPYDDYKRVVFAQHPIPTIDRSSDYMDYAAWARNLHRAEFLLPNGMYHLAGMQLLAEQRLVGDLSFHRDVGPDFTDLDLLVLREAQRHINRAFTCCRARQLAMLAPATMPTERHQGYRQAQQQYQLSLREYEVAFHAAHGLHNRQIADRLGISENTVKSHLKHLQSKTRTHNRAELVYCLFGQMSPRG